MVIPLVCLPDQARSLEEHFAAMDANVKHPFDS
jgi:hypothetical protein